MPIKETPCDICKGTGEFEGKHLSDCTECQGTGFMWVRKIDRSEEYDKINLKENKNEFRL